MSFAAAAAQVPPVGTDFSPHLSRFPPNDVTWVQGRPRPKRRLADMRTGLQTWGEGLSWGNHDGILSNRLVYLFELK